MAEKRWCYLCPLPGLCGGFRGSSFSGKQRYVIELLLLVKMTLLPSNLASLNWRHMSSLSLRLAWHFSWDPSPGAGNQLSEVVVWVRVQRVHSRRMLIGHNLFISPSLADAF